MAGKRISSLLNLSSMSIGSSGANGNQNGTRRGSDNSSKMLDGKQSPNSRNFSRPSAGGHGSRKNSSSGSYPPSPAQSDRAVHSPLTALPILEQDVQRQSPPPVAETQLEMPAAGPPTGRWGRLQKSGSKPPSRSNSPKPDLAVKSHNEASGEAERDALRPRASRNWLRSRSRSRSTARVKAGPSAWIVGLDRNSDINVAPMSRVEKMAYNVNSLLSAEKVIELWNPEGDTFVHLFPKNAGCGPSFRIESSTYSSSALLTRLAHGSLYTDSMNNSARKRRGTLDGDHTAPRGRAPVSPPISPEDDNSTSSSKGSRVLSDASEPSFQEIHLYLPTDPDITSPNAKDTKKPTPMLETLMKVRNLFAFLLGQSLVATPKAPDVFSVFLGIAEMLNTYSFSNLDGSTYGEVATSSFEEYIEELQLTDVRGSAEKTIEAIVIAEKMRSTTLYNEAFVHAVGKYDDILKLGSPKFALISAVTRNRMERATMDLFTRTKNINTRLLEFDFPDIFSGVMNSRTADERKIVRFDEWKSGFMATRRAVLSYYKKKYGSWPPRASSKKNDLATSGLNRLVLIDLYKDFSAMYDLLVDRAKLTTRSLDISVEEEDAESNDEMITRAMRRVLGEYDNSMPPVQPPVPFDCPLLPSQAAVRKPSVVAGSAQDTKARSKKLKDEKLLAVLRAAHNQDAVNYAKVGGNAAAVSGPDAKPAQTNPFLQNFLAFEYTSGRGKTVDELCDLRNGQWLFMYAVLQSLPLLVIDAPGLHHTEGVEYFLCQPSRHGASWARGDDAGPRMHWYGVTGSNGVVSMPADVVEYGVEGVYRRSHCWQVAEKWIKDLQLPDDRPEPQPEEDVDPMQLQAQNDSSQYSQYSLGQDMPMNPPMANSYRISSLSPPFVSTPTMGYPQQGYQQVQPSLPTPPTSVSGGSVVYPAQQSQYLQQQLQQAHYSYGPTPPQPWLSSNPSSPGLRSSSAPQTPIMAPGTSVYSADMQSPQLSVTHPHYPPNQLPTPTHFPPSFSSSQIPSAGHSPQIYPQTYSPALASGYEQQQQQYPFPQRSPSPQQLLSASSAHYTSQSQLQPHMHPQYQPPRSVSPDPSSTGSIPRYRPQHQHSNSLGVPHSPNMYPSRSLGVPGGGAAGGRNKRQSVMDLGLEALPLPAGVMPAGTANKSVASAGKPKTMDPNITFDAIIGGGAEQKRPGTAGATVAGSGHGSSGGGGGGGGGGTSVMGIGLGMGSSRPSSGKALKKKKSRL